MIFTYRRRKVEKKYENTLYVVKSAKTGFTGKFSSQCSVKFYHWFHYKIFVFQMI